MIFVFWLSAAFVLYVYAGYPLALYAYSRFMKRATSGDPESRVSGCGSRNAQCGLRPADRGVWAADREALPAASIVIAARNEATKLAARLDNLLSLDFPADKRQIIVVLDGTTDHSLSALEPYRDVVQVVTGPGLGKASAVNAGVAAARHEIVVFADARQAFAPDALRELVQPFHDPAVGGVTGELLLDAEAVLFSNQRRAGDRRRNRRPTSDRRHPSPSTIGDALGLYWRYEKALRRMESAVGSTLGATGAIYAIRRALWTPLPPETLLDDVLAPMRVVLNGYRIVFNDRARAFDRAATDADAEARRKIRTLAGNFQLLALEPRLLLPWRNPVWLQFVSHKLGRLAVPYALLALFASSLTLAAVPFYLIVLAAQVAFYMLAGLGAYLEYAARLRQSPARERSGTLAIREVVS